MPNSKLEKNIYILYLFFLPFERFIDFDMPMVFQEYLFPKFSSFLFVLGILLVLNKRQYISYNPILKKWKRLYVFQTLYTLSLATILYFPLGPLYGEDTFRATIGGVIFWFVVIVNIYYNYYALTKLVTIDQVFKIIIASSFVLLFVGYLQYAVINIGGSFSLAYAVLAHYIDLLPEDKLSRGVVFFGTEPSSAASLFFLVIPVLIGIIWRQKKKRTKFKYQLLLLSFVPLFVSSGSSTVIIIMIFTVVSVFLIQLNRILLYKIILVLSFFSGLYVAVSYGNGSVKNDQPVMDQKSLTYKISGKIKDTDNMSVMMRSSTIVNDMNIFFDYPFTGVGDGIQGYFYNKNLPFKYLASWEVQDCYSGKKGIIDGGGAFFPCFISAYGVMGLFFLIPLIGQYLYFLKKKKNICLLNRIFMIFAIMFASSGWFGVGIRQNFILLVMLTLPIVALHEESKQKKSYGEV